MLEKVAFISFLSFYILYGLVIILWLTDESWRILPKLSTKYWALKTKQLNPKVSWQIKRRYNSYNPISRRCNLCLNEKLEILDDQDKNLLNKRSEIISHCRHQNKFKLKTIASNTADADIT